MRLATVFQGFLNMKLMKLFRRPAPDKEEIPQGKPTTKYEQGPQGKPTTKTHKELTLVNVLFKRKKLIFCPLKFKIK